ncbi:iron transporter [Arenibaculum sp.]|jgi:hypothetical protein|uniref:iron transporter n=1 Tax=Arenibaculum sp. TaxID=2865862 RepID=UPI002E12CEC3|nr:iron transporter [Arenibaculum sp.]
MAGDKPPMKPSEEVSRTALALATAQGDAYGIALKHMTSIVAHDGGEMRQGDYLIGFAVEKAEGMYHMRGGKLEWIEPDQENVHIEVAVRDASDGRFLPGLKIFATLFDPSGNEVGTHEMPYLWHPALYHYGRNWKVPGDGTYRLRVRFEAPDFPRHDEVNGKRFETGADVEFPKVEIKTGKG